MTVKCHMVTGIPKSVEIVESRSIVPDYETINIKASLAPDLSAFCPLHPPESQVLHCGFEYGDTHAPNLPVLRLVPGN